MFLSGSNRLNGWAAGLAVVAALALVPAAVAVASSAKTASKGPVPADAFVAGHPVDKSKVPDFIPALDQSGNQVGYVARDLAMPDNANAGSEADIPVYADDLTTVVGRMVAGKGFVAIGKSAADVAPVVQGTAEK